MLEAPPQPPQRPAREAESAAPVGSVLVVLGLAGVTLVVFAIAWWIGFAPLVTTDDPISSLLVNDGEFAWDGALVMPLMVGAAVIAAAVAVAFALPPGMARTRAWSLAVALPFVSMILLGTAIDKVAGELMTLGVEHITAVPFVPHAIGTWAVVVTGVATGTGLLSVAIPSRDIAALLALLLAAGFLLVAVLLAVDSGDVGSFGFAAIVAAAGVWLGLVVAAARRERLAAPSASPTA